MIVLLHIRQSLMAVISAAMVTGHIQIL